jgi:hypothetical protein
MPSLRLAKIDQLRLVGCLIFLVTSTINIMNEYQGIYLILTVFARVVVSLVHMKFNVDNKEIHLGIYHPESNLSRAGIRAFPCEKAIIVHQYLNSNGGSRGLFGPLLSRAKNC